MGKLDDIFSGTKRFGVLSKLAKTLLVLPNSNADSERAFSIIKKIHTEFRSDLNNDTICGLLSCKFNQNQSRLVIGTSKNSWFCKEIREDNFRFWWRRVHKDASQGMYMSKIEIFFFTARILQNQRMLCCGECFHD